MSQLVVAKDQNSKKLDIAKKQDQAYTLLFSELYTIASEDDKVVRRELYTEYKRDVIDTDIVNTEIIRDFLQRCDGNINLLDSREQLIYHRIFS